MSLQTPGIQLSLGLSKVLRIRTNCFLLALRLNFDCCLAGLGAEAPVLVGVFFHLNLLDDLDRVSNDVPVVLRPKVLGPADWRIGVFPQRAVAGGPGEHVAGRLAEAVNLLSLDEKLVLELLLLLF
jgi:hypothetical protein